MRDRAASALRSGERGQAMVESAIVLPMYVFLMLGLLQLGMLHQARLLTKYAAYKAVRAGSLHGASIDEMERAALGVLLPLISEKRGGTESIKPVSSAGDYAMKWTKPTVLGNRHLDALGLQHAEITICGPLQGEDLPGRDEVDFDDPSIATGGGWKDSQRTKLRAQVTFNYRMPIPFANMVIHAFAYGRELATVLRMDGDPSFLPRLDAYSRASRNGVYIMPIRANYTMRMMSNLYPRNMPRSNQCVIPFAKM